MTVPYWLQAGADACLLTISWACIATVLSRNLISTVQLATAAWVFKTRLNPSVQSEDLWSRTHDLALPVSVIAPAFNEQLSVVDSVTALLALQYPDHEVILVNDGSSDETLPRLIDAFGLAPISRSQAVALQRTRIRGVYGSPAHPKLLVVDKENGRKADAVNAGIGFAQRPLVCVIDADSIIEPDGLLRATEPFMSDDGRLVAVGGAVRVVNGSAVRGGHIMQIALSPNWLPRFQVVEYLRAFLTARVANAEMSMLLLISGAFGVFRRSALVQIGGYRHDTVGEDLEIVTRLHRHMRDLGVEYEIGFIPEVVCWTEVPETVSGLRNQRSRWQQGAIETIAEHRGMLFNPAYGRIGLIAMPLLLLEDVLGPPLELLGYITIPVGFLLGIISPQIFIAFMCLTIVFGTAISVGTLVLEEKQLKRTPSTANLGYIALAALLENFGYRQMNLVFRLKGMRSYLRKEIGWAGVERRGFDRQSSI